MDMGQVRAATYSRNSSAKQKSINDQRAENRRAAQELGWTVPVELDDPSSASRHAPKVRRNWEKLLELLPEVDVVVLWGTVCRRQGRAQTTSGRSCV